MEKVDYKHGKFVILTTLFEAEDFDYEDYLEWCEMNNVEPKEKDSEEFYEWAKEETMNNYESDMENIKSCKQYKVPVVITGKLGLWDGTHEIMPVTCDNVAVAVEKCVSESEDCNVCFNDGAIEVEAHHHDGVNMFTIRALSAKGLKKSENAVYAKQHFKRLPYLYAIF